MMFSLFVVLASLASICSATEFSVEPLRNAASRQVFKEIDARVKAGNYGTIIALSQNA